MTNKEKFKEIFGYEANTDECPIYCSATDGGNCPYYNSTSNVCSAGYWWDAEYKEPTTKNDLGVASELEKNSKKLEKDFGELDCISRAEAIRVASGYCHPSNIAKELAKLPSVIPQDPKSGHWVKYGIPRCGEQHYKCTNCDEYFNFGLYSDYYKKAFKFCPNCGCAMVEPQESEKV